MSDSRKIVDKSLKLTENRCTYAEGGPITPRSLADAWTPPEEAYPEPEKEYPLTGKFLDIIGEYPSIIKNAVANTVAYPHDIYTGEKQLYNFDPETGERRISDEAIGKALDVSNAAMTGGFGLAAIRPPVAGEYSNTLRMFAGPNSKTADLEALASAKDMIKNKVPAEEVRQSTGWELTPHGDWRYEIADNKARLSQMAEEQMAGGAGKDTRLLKDPEREKFYSAGQFGGSARYFLDHPELFEAYPELTGMILKARWTPDRSRTGSFGPLGMTVGASHPDEALSAALHEAQHYVQKQEGWSRGANTRAIMADNTQAYKESLERIKYNLDYAKTNLANVEEGSLNWANLKAYEKRLKENRKELKTALKPENLNREAWDEYKRTAGEVEARLTENRRLMNAEQRRKRMPATDQDVRFDDQIVRRQMDANGGAIHPLHRAGGGETSWWDKAGDYLSYIPITKHPMVQAALYALDPTPANEGEDETARQIAHGLRSGWEGSAETPVERKFGGKTAKSGPVVEQALMLTLKKASSRRGRPD